jgi:hypothetical protein
MIMLRHPFQQWRHHEHADFLMQENGLGLIHHVLASRLASVVNPLVRAAPHRRGSRSTLNPIPPCTRGNSAINLPRCAARSAQA